MNGPRTPRVLIGLTLAVLGGLVAPEASYAQSVARKAGRGLAAITTPFLEVPGNMRREARRRGNAEGLPVGFVMGLGMMVPRMLVGVYELLSAPLATPAGYRPILEPEFPWDYFD